MIELLNFLIRYCSKLFEKREFSVKDIKVGANAFYGSSILLESDDVEIFISNERDQILWQMRSKYDTDRKIWFSFDLLSQLLGQRVATGVMDANNSELLSVNLDEILSRFRKENAPLTIKRLKELRIERGKRI